MQAEHLYSDGDLKRLLPTPPSSPYRTEFRRDHGRLIHSAVFRRLQGKTQLFPCYESDFFRNRLTHSIEVAQIAKGIAERINYTDPNFKGANSIDLNLVETAALAHDLGHPPFGHNGEAALDGCMKGFGGFEGNAQTLRILTKLEKKDRDGNSPAISNGIDNRVGLNLTSRALLSVLKYDNMIPASRDENDKLVKGYYYTESNIVRRLKANVFKTSAPASIKTIECQIMDIADDIAYSTYDLEDAFKGGFLSPIKILNNTRDFIEKLTVTVNDSLRYHRLRVDENEVNQILFRNYEGIFREETVRKIRKVCNTNKIKELNDIIALSVQIGAMDVYEFSSLMCEDGHIRINHTSSMINEYISAVKVKYNQTNPALSLIAFSPNTRKKVEVLKRYVYATVINSPILKISETRGYDIVKDIFLALTDNRQKGHNLLPQDYRSLYDSFDGDDALQKRVICDFIAGMTDRYAVEFYCRLKSETPQTIFKPF
ncbi:MAG: dNTP triphosphohydrolase [Deltaproteobacteria bacterium]|nr:dNTP triphosphohydrolase [Deltaproteobacteria bacterium]